MFDIHKAAIFLHLADNQLYRCQIVCEPSAGLQGQPVHSRFASYRCFLRQRFFKTLQWGGCRETKQELLIHFWHDMGCGQGILLQLGHQGGFYEEFDVKFTWVRSLDKLRLGQSQWSTTLIQPSCNFIAEPLQMYEPPQTFCFSLVDETAIFYFILLQLCGELKTLMIL